MASELEGVWFGHSVAIRGSPGRRSQLYLAVSLVVVVDMMSRLRREDSDWF